ncbi:MAG: aminotransferase class V-fold PLP-dependent enzyme [Pseudomonadota bacterium]
MLKYFDYASTTPVDERVLSKMLPYFNKYFGNSGSNHKLGEYSKLSEENARQQVAQLINARPSEIIFTSGATEANNLGIRGCLGFYTDKQHWISVQSLHKSIRDIDRNLTNNTVLKVNSAGLVDILELEKAITENTLLVAVSIVCSETGVMQNIKEISQLCKAKGIFLHCDLAQGFGKIDIDVEELGIDLASISGHKIYGPKGIGALYVRGRNPRIKLRPLIYGGGQERGIRNGTLPTSLIVGLGTAAELAMQEMNHNFQHIRTLAQFFIEQLISRIDKVYINGGIKQVITNDEIINIDKNIVFFNKNNNQKVLLFMHYPGIVNISFAGIEGEALMGELDNICVSSGSACTSSSLESSYVLKALGVGDDLAHTSLRFSFGKDTLKSDVVFLLDKLEAAVKRLREISPLWDMIQQGIDLNSIKWKD